MYQTSQRSEQGLSINSKSASTTSNREASGSFIFGGYRSVNAAANIEVADDCDRLWAAGLYKIVQNPVDNRFVKHSFVAIRPEIKLKRLKLHTKFRRHVTNADCCKVWLFCARAKVGKFGTLHRDLKIPFRTRIGKSLQFFARFRGHFPSHLNAAGILFH